MMKSMRNPSRPAIVLLSGSVLVCVTCALAAQDSRPVSQASSRPMSEATARETPPNAAAVIPGKGTTGSKAALALARRVFEYAGGSQGLAKVHNVVFTFDGHRLFWDFTVRKVRVEYPKPKRLVALGTPLDVLVFDIAKDENVLRHPPRRHRHAPRISAKSTWINDTYWLLVTLKVLDPGVTLAIDPRQEGDLASIQRLRLRFAGGTGITPANEYVLHVEAETGRVTRWDFYRRAGARPRSWEFKNYQKVGPLRLSLSRPEVGEARRPKDIELGDVQVNVKVPNDVWTATERLFLNGDD